MVRFLDEQDERNGRDDYRGRRPSSPTRSHHSGGHRDRDYSPDFISGPGSRVPRPYHASGAAIPSTATATVHNHPVPPPPVPSPPLSPPPMSTRGGGGGPPQQQYVYDDDRSRNGAPMRGRDRSWERGSGTARNISVSRSRSRSRGPSSATVPTAGPGTRERRIFRETKIFGGPELRDPERAAQALAVSDSHARDRRGGRSPSRESRVSRDTSRSRSRARSIYTTDDDSDYPHRRRRSPSRSRSTRARRSQSRSRSARSRSQRSPSPAPLRHKGKDLFSPSTAALGVGVLGAIVGGLAAREATEHASYRHHKSNKSYDGHRSRKDESRERKAALISTIVGAAVGGLGANAIERKLEEKKKLEEGEKRAREKGGYRELRDRNLNHDDYGGSGRSRSRHGSSLDTTGYSDDYYGSSSGTTTARGGR